LATLKGIGIAVGYLLGIALTITLWGTLFWIAEKLFNWVF